MLEELYKFIELTGMMRLLHRSPSLKAKPPEVVALEKAYLIQVRLDLEAKAELATREG
jgi:hypothetical protein